MIKRISMAVVAALAVMGLAIMVSPSASALPLTGTHTVSMACGPTQQVTWNYTVTHLSVSSGRHYFEFQLNYTTWTGASVEYGPKGLVDFRRRPAGTVYSTVYLGIAGGGGGGNAIDPWPRNTADGPTTTRTNGVGGVSFLPFGFNMSPAIPDRENRLSVSFDGHPECLVRMPLNTPTDYADGHPVLGTSTVEFNCSSPDINDGEQQRLVITYEMNDLGTMASPGGIVSRRFSVKVTKATYSGPEIDFIALDVEENVGGAPTALNPAGSANWVGNVANFQDIDGVNGVSFPTKVVHRPIGGVPILQLHAGFYYPSVFSEPCHAYSDTTAEGLEFLDYESVVQCEGQTPGVLRIEAEWEINHDLLTRMRAHSQDLPAGGYGVRIHNDSDYWMRFPGPGVTGSGFTYTFDPTLEIGPGPYGTLSGPLYIAPNSSEYLPTWDSAWTGDNPFSVWSDQDMVLVAIPDLYDTNNEFQCGQGVLNVPSSPLSGGGEGLNVVSENIKG